MSKLAPKRTEIQILNFKIGEREKNGIRARVGEISISKKGKK